MKTRVLLGRNAEATAGIIDSQSVKTTDKDGIHGYDGAKKVNGRKRHLVVDTLGFLLALQVSSAKIQDRDQTFSMLQEAKSSSSKLIIVWADQGYRSEKLKDAIYSDLGVKLSIVGDRRPTGIWWPKDKPLPSDLAAHFDKGFKLVKKRWIVDRTFGWLGKYRRLSKDYEFQTVNSESMIYVAMSNNMTKRASALV